MMSRDFETAAARLLTDLMPVAILVSGEGAEALSAALEAAGAAAELLSAGATGPYDLAILRADPRAFATPDTQARLAALTARADRLVFMPLPDSVAPDSLTAWFEHLTELGYQPVVEYDASYLAEGAFLVDRNATAAETDLAGFTERLSLGGALHATTVRVAELEAELAGAGAALKAELAAQRAALSEAETRIAALTEAAAVWAPLQSWVRQAVARVPAAARPRSGVLARLFRRAPPHAAPDPAARIRQCKLFDAAWYIACHPELAETGADPALHYVQTGAAAGYDPGPWFDSAAYLARTPGLDPAHTPPLLHAIETGEAAALLAGAL
jgi:hypothetical protein